MAKAAPGDFNEELELELVKVFIASLSINHSGFPIVGGRVWGSPPPS